MKKRFPLSVIALALAGCASTASFEGNDAGWTIQLQPDASFALDQDTVVLFGDTTFGRYAFRVEQESGKIFYGSLPLEFQEERVLWDILFPPLWLFNLNAVYSFYQFDPDSAVIRYRASESDPWQEWSPTAAEIKRARGFFRELY